MARIWVCHTQVLAIHLPILGSARLRMTTSGRASRVIALVSANVIARHFMVPLALVSWWWLPISALLLRWVPRTLRTGVTTTTSWRRILLLLAIRRLAHRRTVSLRRSAITLIWRSAVALTWRSAVLASRRHAARCAAHVLLLVLGVVARVNGAENELEHPEIRSEIDRRLCAGHLGRLIFIV